ncbi:MAG: hypothetical protein K2I30_02550 [Clostridia bacterium]|nr:hypothetical protein [Clostridia bacterium]
MKTKKFLISVLLLILICLISVSFCLSGCTDGKDGAAGKSAYEIWLEEGHTGSQADFLEWLKGDDGQNGTNGTDGKSAYHIWLDNGHAGTEADFLTWLKGQGGTSGGDGSEQNGWDVSENPVTAELTASVDNYILNISGSGNMKNWTKADDVPWYGLGDKIEKINIGGEVTGIGDFAFSNIGVTSLVIPENVKRVGNYALPPDCDVYINPDTAIQPAQNEGIRVSVYSENVPETYDRHWTSWGSSGNITDAPFAEEKSYWHFNENNEPAVWNKMKVLFIGNSFTFYYQIPAQFSAIAKDLGYYVETYSITVPGQTLETHAVDASNSGVQINALLNKINDFDYVVLQEQSTRPYTDYNKFFNAVKALKKKVEDTQDHAQVYLYETWGSPASAGDSYEQISEMEQRLYESYTQAASDLGCRVSYAGRAFTLVKGETDINLYFGDNRHPGPAGAYLSACVHVATILGVDVRKTTLTGKDLVVIANEGASAQPMNLSAEQCETLRAAAYKTVFEGTGQTETYTVRFWYNGQLQTEKTAVEGFGLTLPSCTVAEGEKFSGWILKDGDTAYAADTRISYASISGHIKDGVIDFYAQTHETVIAVWGRWITEENFLKVMEGFKVYCADNVLNYDKVGYIYYAGKTQNTDPYFLIADFTGQVAKDDADIVFPCGDNIANAAQSAIASSVVESKALGVTVEGNTTRYVAKLNEKTLTDAFYTYITTDAAKAILNALN